MDRNSRLTAKLDKNMLGLEIGASFSPIVRKDEGWNVKVVDHATQEELRAKYQKDLFANINNIETVDIVWTSRALHDSIPQCQHNTFDYCIASHVLEHIPDLLNFLKSMEILLKPNSILSLALPDKRFSFDSFKPISTTADVLSAHFNRNAAARHSAKTVFENIAYNVKSGEAPCWEQLPLEDLSIYSSLSQAIETFSSPVDDPNQPYSDCHAWYFTPSSFRLILMELRALGHTRFYIEEVSPAIGAEFFARLRLSPITDSNAEWPTSDERLALLTAILAEQVEQFTLFSEPLRRRLAALLPKGHPPIPGMTQPQKQQMENDHLKKENDHLKEENDHLKGQRKTAQRMNEQLNQILNSYSWRLVSAFWTKVDAIKKILNLKAA